METINATGRRKTAVARVYVRPGKGEIKVNRRDLNVHFPTEIHQIAVKRPLTILSLDGQYDVVINISGGGIKGQAQAASLGIARALVSLNAENRVVLKKEGLLTRDSRMVERKKYGRRKARRKFQFSKR